MDATNQGAANAFPSLRSAAIRILESLTYKDKVCSGIQLLDFLIIRDTCEPGVTWRLGEKKGVWG